MPNDQASLGGVLRRLQRAGSTCAVDAGWGRRERNFIEAACSSHGTTARRSPYGRVQGPLRFGRERFIGVAPPGAVPRLGLRRRRPAASRQPATVAVRRSVDLAAARRGRRRLARPFGHPRTATRVLTAGKAGNLYRWSIRLRTSAPAPFAGQSQLWRQEGLHRRPTVASRPQPMSVRVFATTPADALGSFVPSRTRRQAGPLA